MTTWNENNKELIAERSRARHYKDDYGEMMMEQYGVDGQEGYDFLLKEQDYRCKWCGMHNDDIEKQKKENRKKKGLPESKRSMPNFLHDHCHKTDVIRGLLCSRCNTAIGGYEFVIDTGEEKIQNYLMTEKKEYWV
jgi:hypothetical protein